MFSVHSLPEGVVLSYCGPCLVSLPPPTPQKYKKIKTKFREELENVTGEWLGEGDRPSELQFLRTAMGEPVVLDPPPNPSLSLTQARLTHPHYMLCAGPGCAPAQACLSLQDTVDASV